MMNCTVQSRHYAVLMHIIDESTYFYIYLQFTIMVDTSKNKIT